MLDRTRFFGVVFYQEGGGAGEREEVQSVNGSEEDVEAIEEETNRGFCGSVDSGVCYRVDKHKSGRGGIGEVSLSIFLVDHW